MSKIMDDEFTSWKTSPGQPISVALATDAAVQKAVVVSCLRASTCLELADGNCQVSK